jgi:hypothetical protein
MIEPIRGGVGAQVLRNDVRGRREVLLHRQCSGHDNILRVVDALQTRTVDRSLGFERTVLQLYLVLEMCARLAGPLSAPPLNSSRRGFRAVQPAASCLTASSLCTHKPAAHSPKRHGWSVLDGMCVSCAAAVGAATIPDDCHWAAAYPCEEYCSSRPQSAFRV